MTTTDLFLISALFEFVAVVLMYRCVKHWQRESNEWERLCKAMADADDASSELEPYQYGDLRSAQIRDQFESECA